MAMATHRLAGAAANPSGRSPLVCRGRHGRHHGTPGGARVATGGVRAGSGGSITRVCSPPGPLVVVEQGSRGSWSGVDSRATGASSPAEATMSAAVGFPVTRRVPTGTGSGGGTPDLVVWNGVSATWLHIQY